MVSSDFLMKKLLFKFRFKITILWSNKTKKKTNILTCLKVTLLGRMYFDSVVLLISKTSMSSILIHMLISCRWGNHCRFLCNVAY